MKNFFSKVPFVMLNAIIFICYFPAIGQTSNVEEEKQAIKNVIQESYVEGLQNEGDATKIDAGFHPGFNLLGIGIGDEIWKLPIYTWREKAINDVKSGKKPKTGDDLVSVNFLSVDVTGTAAVVKLEFFVGTTKKYIDYISLYKFESGWKIVNKIFYKLPEEKQ